MDDYSLVWFMKSIHLVAGIKYQDMYLGILQLASISCEVNYNLLIHVVNVFQTLKNIVLALQKRLYD